jgi:DNA-binding Lrp family transcriptional regulator
LLNIPEDYRIVFSLREMSGLNVSETAEALNISEANVKVRLNRAKSMLRKEIEKTYTPQEIFEFNLIYCDTMVENVMKKIIQKVSDGHHTKIH